MPAQPPPEALGRVEKPFGPATAFGCGGFAMLTLPAAAIAYSTPMVIGSLYVLAISGNPVLYALGGLLIFCHMVVSASCLSHAKIFAARLVAADELEKQKQVVSLLLSDFEEGASDWLWEVDATGALTYVSDRMAAASGADKEALIGRPMSELCGAPEGPAGPIASLAALFAEQKPFRDVTIPIRVGSENHSWSLSAKPVHDLDGQFIGFRGVGADITQARDDQARISRLAHYDVLTQLPNRLSFLQALSTDWGDHGRPRSQGACRVPGRSQWPRRRCSSNRSRTRTTRHPPATAPSSAPPARTPFSAEPERPRARAKVQATARTSPARAAAVTRAKTISTVPP